MALASCLRVRKTLSATVVLTICLAVAPPLSAQERFHTTDATVLPALPGMRIVSVKDSLRNRCYLAFVEDAARPDAALIDPPDVTAAASQRDHDLASLVHAYESDTSVYAGTITPNPLKYEVLAQTTQLTFALSVVENLIARLEAQLDRVAAAPRTLAVVQDACAPAEAGATAR